MPSDRAYFVQSLYYVLIRGLPEITSRPSRITHHAAPPPSIQSRCGMVSRLGILECWCGVLVPRRYRYPRRRRLSASDPDPALFRSDPNPDLFRSDPTPNSSPGSVRRDVLPVPFVPGISIVPGLSRRAPTCFVLSTSARRARARKNWIFRTHRLMCRQK